MAVSHAQAMTQRLTEESINEELGKLGMPNATVMTLPVVVSGDDLGNELNAGLGSAGVALAIGVTVAVCACGALCAGAYFWNKKTTTQARSTQQEGAVEMQESADRVAEEERPDTDTRHGSEQLDTADASANAERKRGYDV